MPRKLPWATKDSPVVKEKRPRPALKKNETSSSETDTPAMIKSKSSTPFKSSRKRASSRTPSTSPPPGPPDEEYMIEGYEHDDIYIMVEDEFHSTAQTFTQHLHHAEYQRLKKKAKDAAPPTFQPTGQMRAETRKKLEARALRAKQNDAVGNIIGGFDLSGDEDEGQDDPWLGTSLSGLMTDANTHKRTALVGLDKIQSATRAAKGFGRGLGDSPAGRKEKMSIFDIFSAKGKSKEIVVDGQEHGSSEDDLDPPSKAKVTISKHAPHERFSGRETGVSHEPIARPNPSLRTTTKPSASTSIDANTRAHSRLREPSVAARKLFDDFDNFENVDKRSSSAIQPRSSSSRKHSKSKHTKDKKMQMNDIPTFLV